MYFNYPLLAHWDVLIKFSLKENVKGAVNETKIIHIVTKDLCKIDTSKMEPEQNRGYVTFVRSKSDPNDLENIKNKCPKYHLSL